MKSVKTMSEAARQEALELGIGKKIKELRKKRGMTLAQVGELSAFSVGLLSQIENDGVVPPIPTLLAIARALEVKINAFFQSDEDNPRVIVVRKDQRIVESRRRPADVGYHYSALAHMRSEKRMEPFLVEFEQRSRESMNFFSHQGEEFIYVIDGIIEFRSEDDPALKRDYILEAGDSIYFDSDRPHAARGIDTGPCKALIVVAN